jgi:hypothetical protein
MMMMMMMIRLNYAAMFLSQHNMHCHELHAWVPTKASGTATETVQLN